MTQMVAQAGAHGESCHFVQKEKRKLKKSRYFSPDGALLVEELVKRDIVYGPDEINCILAAKFRGTQVDVYRGDTTEEIMGLRAQFREINMQIRDRILARNNPLPALHLGE